MEMLIVVAIIAILIAISIPLVNSALEKAKHATDAANERAAKAVALIADLEGEKIDGTAFSRTKAYAYDAKTGKLTSTAPAAAAFYGKHKGHNGFIVVQVDATTGNVFMDWKDSLTAAGGGALTLSSDGATICSGKDVGH